ncbi:MAG: HU family DNA-binding protein [Chloroflexi bacterium]|nr:HU family DNA-binding protein [Chloroflexota bacterium]
MNLLANLPPSGPETTDHRGIARAILGTGTDALRLELLTLLIAETCKRIQLELARGRMVRLPRLGTLALTARKPRTYRLPNGTTVRTHSRSRLTLLTNAAAQSRRRRLRPQKTGGAPQ